MGASFRPGRKESTPSRNLPDFTGTALRVMAAILLISTVVVLFVTRTSSAASFGSALYDASDPLQIIEGTDEFFRATRSKASRAHLVEFYNSWCGHCIRYAPLFKEFAGDVQGWHSVVDISVINCASDANHDVCRTQDITAYPSIKMYWIDNPDIRRGEEVNAHRDISLLRAAVIDYIEKKIKEFGAPANFPKLEASRATSLPELWTAQPSNVTQILAVIEEPDSYVGRETILDLSGNHNVSVVRFIRGSGPEEIKNRDATSLVVLEKGVHPRLLTSVADKAAVRKEFKERLNTMGFKAAHPYKANGKMAQPLPKAEIGDPDKVYLDDVEAGLGKILNSELMVRKQFDERELVVLRDFIQAVYENIVLPERIKVYLQRLRHQLEVPAPLEIEAYKKILSEANSSAGSLRQNVEFFGCKGSVPNKRGYSCSLWTIFHLITVGGHQRYLKNQIQDPKRLVFIVRDFVSNFFSCKDCVNHFVSMAKNLESELTSPAESALWLWRAHNKVNARVKGDETEDPARPKVQFPPASLCKNCTDVNGNFIESNVLTFLHQHYNGSMLVHKAVEHSARALGLSQDNEDSSSANARLFSGFDVTIFLVIYAVSITLLFGVFVTIVFRRRKGSFSKSLFRLS